MSVHIQEEAYEIFRRPGDLLLTCEHASERLPAPWEWPQADRRLVGTHWAWDIGAAQLAQELNEDLGGTLLLSRFSRLLIDPNRPLESDTLFRQVAEGRPVELNQDLRPADIERRISGYWRPYHQALSRAVEQTSGQVVLSMHTFTPDYEGQIRTVEVGVLFNEEEALGRSLHAALRKAGFVTELNEPWSGKEGLMYAIEHHARTHGRRALELEVRQDLAVEEVFRRRFVPVLAAWLGQHL